MNKSGGKLMKARLGVAFMLMGLPILGTTPDARAIPMDAELPPLIAYHFKRTGIPQGSEGEALIAPLTKFGGVTTSQLWSDTVEVTVSNVGYNFPAIGGFTDAFYYYTPGTPDA